MFYNLLRTRLGSIFCWAVGHGWDADMTAGGHAYMQCRTCREIVWLDE